jgi:hypothetical protein
MVGMDLLNPERKTLHRHAGGGNGGPLRRGQSLAAEHLRGRAQA